MNKRFQKLINLYRKFGLKKACILLFHILISKIYRKNDDLLLLMDLNKEIKFSGKSRIQIQSIENHHFPLLIQFNKKYREAQRITYLTGYQKNGYKGYLAFINNELIGYMWWVDNKIIPTKNHPSIFRFELCLKDDDIYWFDLFIVPNYRGSGYAVEFISKITFELRKLGYNRAMGLVASDNRPAKLFYFICGNKIVKHFISYEWFSLFLFQDEKIFIKNSRWHPVHPYDHRLLFSLKRK